MPRRSPVLLVACLLALATGISLMRLSGVSTPPAPARSSLVPDAVANTVLVRRFYAAVEVAVATGNAELLDALLAPAFVDHAVAPGQPPDRAGLAQELAALHAVVPTLRLGVTDLVAQDDEVMARVQVSGVNPAAFLGLPLPADWPMWSAVDLFRFAGGRIVERWGWPPPPALLQPLPAARLAEPDAPLAVHVVRVTVAPGGIGAAPGTVAPTLLWVESGRPRVTLDAVYAVRADVTRATAQERSGTPQPIVPESTVDLGEGDLVRFEDTNFTVSNPGTTPAVLLAVTTATTLFAGSETVGISPQVVPDVCRMSPHPGPVAVAVGRVTLAAGASFPLRSMAALQQVAVETGSGIVADDAAEEVRNASDAPRGFLVVTITRG